MSGSSIFIFVSLVVWCTERVNSEGLGNLTRVFFITQPMSTRACGRDKDGKNISHEKKFLQLAFSVFNVFCIVKEIVFKGSFGLCKPLPNRYLSQEFDKMSDMISGDGSIS